MQSGYSPASCLVEITLGSSSGSTRTAAGDLPHSFDQLGSRCRCQTPIGRDQRRPHRFSQLDVQGIDETQVVAPPPCAHHQRSEEMPRCGNLRSTFDPGFDLVHRKETRSVESSQRRQDLGVEVSGDMDLAAPEAMPDAVTRLGAGQQIHHRRSIQHDSLNHARRPGRRGPARWRRSHPDG